tara:strand:- start:508 stop:1482 length:975 start_codon:yes stop_codon:yes gene_type:complete
MQHIKLLKSIENVDKQILLLESYIGNYNTEIGSKEKKIGISEKEIGNYSKDIGKIEKQIGHLEKQIGHLEKQIGLYEKEIGEIEKQIGLCEKDIGDVEKLIGEDQKEIGRVEKDIGEWNHLKNKKLREYKVTPYYYVKRWILKNHTHLLSAYNDTISDGQYDSKFWLINELNNIKWKNDLHIEIIGGWFGFPLIEMLAHLPIKQIDFYEIDEECKKVLTQYVEQFNYNFRIVQFGNYFERTDLRRRDLIINTSCEHMNDISLMKSFYKDSPIIALQSNNFYEHDHVNCVESEIQLRNNNEITVTKYMGMKEMEKYKRFMVIGEW